MKFLKHDSDKLGADDLMVNLPKLGHNQFGADNA
jgi:hypothetical protein